MKQFLALKDKIMALISKEDNYIIVSDGKAIQQNIKENEIELLVRDNYDTTEICNRPRTDEEDEIVLKSSFTTVVNIYKSSTLKVIRLNDETKHSNIVFNIVKDIDVNITNIYFDIITDTKALVEVVCEKRSNVTYTSIHASEDDFKERLNFFVANDAHLTLNTLSLNNKYVNNITNIYLYKENSYAKVNNAIINNTGITQSYAYNVYHWERDTTSELTNYAICKDSSVLNINSNGIIKRECCRSKINQKSRGVILDLTSSISANPLLEIDEFDVEANHGASIGAIDDEDLYYLMSRGLTKEESENLIVTAYMNPLLKQINDQLILEYINKLLINKL